MKKRRARKKLDESKTVEIPATVEERLRNYEGNAGDTMMTQCDRTLHRTLPIPEAFRRDSGNVRSRKGSMAASLDGSGDHDRTPQEVVDTPM